MSTLTCGLLGAPYDSLMHMDKGVKRSILTPVRPLCADCTQQLCWSILVFYPMPADQTGNAGGWKR